MKLIALALAALSLATVPTSSYAAPCKDAKGRFIKCPTVKPKTAAKPAAKPAAKGKTTQCRDAKGRFMKCKK